MRTFCDRNILVMNEAAPMEPVAVVHAVSVVICGMGELFELERRALLRT